MDKSKFKDFDDRIRAGMHEKYGLCEKERCSSIKKNILNLMTAVGPEVGSSAAPVLLSEIFETSRCSDDNLSHLRQAYINRISATSATAVDKVWRGDELTDAELMSVQKAVFHYREWTYKEIVNSLPFHMKWWKKFDNNATSILAALGLVATSVKLGRSVWHMMNVPARKTVDATALSPGPPKISDM